MFVNRMKHSNEEKILKGGTMYHCRAECLDTLFGAWKHEDCTKMNQKKLTFIIHELQKKESISCFTCAPGLYVCLVPVCSILYRDLTFNLFMYMAFRSCCPTGHEIMINDLKDLTNFWTTYESNIMLGIISIYLCIIL